MSLLLFHSKKDVGSAFLFYDDFSDGPVAAPFGATRITAPGPGVWTVSDPGDRISINAGGEVLLNGWESTAGDTFLRTGEIGVVRGTALYARTVIQNRNHIGWYDVQAAYAGRLCGSLYSSGEFAFYSGNFELNFQMDDYALNDDVEIVMVRREPGVWVYIREAGNVDWRLFAFSRVDYSALLYGVIVQQIATATGQVSDFAIRHLRGRFEEDAVHETRLTAPADAMDFDVPADSYWWIERTARDFELRFRIAGPDDYWTLKTVDTGGGVWRIQIQPTVAGVAGTATTGSRDVNNTALITLKTSGSDIRVGAPNANTRTQRDIEITNATHQLAVGGYVVSGGANVTIHVFDLTAPPAVAQELNLFLA